MTIYKIERAHGSNQGYLERKETLKGMKEDVKMAEDALNSALIARKKLVYTFVDGEFRHTVRQVSKGTKLQLEKTKVSKPKKAKKKQERKAKARASATATNEYLLEDESLHEYFCSFGFSDYQAMGAIMGAEWDAAVVRCNQTNCDSLLASCPQCGAVGCPSCDKCFCPEGAVDVGF